MDNSFFFYHSWIEALEGYTDDAIGKLVRAIDRYVREGSITEFEDKGIKQSFIFIRQDIDRAKSKKEEISAKRAASGRKGAVITNMIRWSQGNEDVDKIGNCQQNQLKDKEKEKEKEKDKDKEKENSKKKFSVPTIDEVKQYCEERKNNINPEAFIDYYSSTGWLIGNKHMKDWRAAVRTWERRERCSRSKDVEGILLGIGEYIDSNGDRRYGKGNFPPVPMSAPPRPSEDCVFSKESMSWIPAGL